MTDPTPADVDAIIVAILGRTALTGARALLTSTDPAVHRALLRALIRAGVLTGYEPGAAALLDEGER